MISEELAFCTVGGTIVVGYLSGRDAIEAVSFPDYPELEAVKTREGFIQAGNIYRADPGTMHLMSELDI
jgi:hypothetical protein